MNLHDVMEDPKAQELAREILTDVGLGADPCSYSEERAHKLRCSAANMLAEVILAKAQAGATIAPPIDEIVRIVVNTAKSIERDLTRLTMTYAVMEIAIFGHIWIGQLTARGHKRFDQIMAKDGTLSIMKGMIGYGSPFTKGGGCSSGGGGNDCGSCNSGGGCGGCKP